MAVKTNMLPNGTYLTEAKTGTNMLPSGIYVKETATTTNNGPMVTMIR